MTTTLEPRTIDAQPAGQVPIARVSVLIFAVLFGWAMSLYPGWSRFDAGSVGHDFWRNFLCDLQSSELPDGRSNRAGSLVVTCAVMVLLAGALLPTWWRVDASPRKVRVARTLGLSTAMLLCLSVGELVLRLPFSHNVLTLTAGAFGLSAMGIVLATSWRHAHRVTRVVAVLFLVAAVINFTTYSAVQLGATLTLVVPASQRIALIGLLVWLALHERDQAQA
tara:strand:+ start:3316 stop:3981 length:666 start_codon:yes stop_codon:yes gene_type:complete